MEWAGIGHLCPCISLTCRDKARIVDYLKAPESNKPSLNLLNKGLLRKEPGEPYLSHECPAYRNVQIEMLVSLSASEQLITDTRYQTKLYASMGPLGHGYTGKHWYRQCQCLENYVYAFKSQLIASCVNSRSSNFLSFTHLSTSYCSSSSSSSSSFGQYGTTSKAFGSRRHIL